jgi:hypothetical protein
VQGGESGQHPGQAEVGEALGVPLRQVGHPGDVGTRQARLDGRARPSAPVQSSGGAKGSSAPTDGTT